MLVLPRDDSWIRFFEGSWGHGGGEPSLCMPTLRTHLNPYLQRLFLLFFLVMTCVFRCHSDCCDVSTVLSEEAYGKVLSPYLDDRRNLFVISSDFCHWGARFRYTFYDARQVCSMMDRLPKDRPKFVI